MRNIKDISIRLEYDNTENSAFSMENYHSCYAFEDEYTRVGVCSSDSIIGRELSIEAFCKKQKPLTYIDVILTFKDDFLREGLLYYNNGYSTNDFVKVESVDPGKESTSRELILFKNTLSGNVLNIAFITFNRFFTYFKTTNDGLLIRHYMESKALDENQKYLLEAFVIDEVDSPNTFLSNYSILLKERHDIRNDKKIPCGWSSWSCYYADINRDKVLKDTQFLANYLNKVVRLIQLDDGWQKDASFCGEWTADLDKFHDGMDAFSKTIKEMGFTFGLWYAPTLMNDKSFFLISIMIITSIIKTVFEELLELGTRRQIRKKQSTCIL